MKVVILAGGRGTRFSEETGTIPKPMIEIGGKPIIWHIMKTYSHFGFNEFIICLGYKGYIIKEYFSHYFLHTSDITINMKKNDIRIHDTKTEPWKVTLVDTGLDTMTGGRIKRIEKYTGRGAFMMTYGDGVGDINIKNLVNSHRKSKKLSTVTIVQPPGRFGAMDVENNTIKSVLEKPKGDGSWINAGYFVLEPEIFKYIKGDETFWEREPMENLAKNKQMSAYKHTGFWKPMDTLRDKIELEKLWESNSAPWQVWKNI